MNWEDSLKDFTYFLRLEKSLSINSIKAYSTDLKKFKEYLDHVGIENGPDEILQDNIRGFIKWINELGMSPRTQARVISGLKAFFRYLLLDERIKEDPTALIESPKIGRNLPDILTLDEINRIEACIDLSKPDGHRNKAIIGVLYGCGLRVSELIDLRISDINMKMGYLKVRGKGEKERRHSRHPAPG